MNATHKFHQGRHLFKILLSFPNALFFLHKKVFFRPRLNIIFLNFSSWHFHFRIYWGINYKCLVSRSVSRYIVHVLHWSLFVAVIEVKMSRQTTLGRFGFKKSISHRNSVMETKVLDFVSTMSRTIKCNHCSKLFDNQQGLSVHEKCVHGVR